MDFELIKNILILLGGLIALLTFLLSYLEYQKQGKQKRVDLYLEMERRLFNNDNFQEIRLLLQKGEPEITKIERKMRSDYAGFFENIAMLMNSKLIKKMLLVTCFLMMLSYVGIMMISGITSLKMNSIGVY